MEYARRWLEISDFSKATMQGYNSRLRNLLEFFEVTRGVVPEDLHLDHVQPDNLHDFIQWRRRIKDVSEPTIRYDLVAVSSLFDFAVTERAAPENPVDLITLPKRCAPDPEWLEVGEAAKLMKASREWVQDPSSRLIPFMDAAIALWLLTGLTRSEGLGLLVKDVDLQDGKIRVRPNDHRPLKTRHRNRDVPIWPQLRPILERQLEEYAEDRPNGLLFPAPRTGRMVGNGWRGFKECVGKAGLSKDRVTIHTLRHTYCATRLQTLDGGQPVSPYTVKDEMGHGSLQMIERVYGHVQERRQRLPEVRYEVAKVVDLQERRSG